jgi:hypothetical protein
MTDQDEKPRRDVRIDQIGFANELVKHYVDPLKDAVKSAHEAGTSLEGDFFTARIDAADKTTVDARRWFKLFSDGEMTRDQFLDAITVSTTDARRVLGEKAFEKASTTVAAGDRLTVTRKKGAEIGLVQAVNTLSHTINAVKRIAA